MDIPGRARWGGSCVLILLATACIGQKRHTGDLEQIQAAGVLRVAVRPGFVHSPAHARDPRNEPGLLRLLAARLGVRLQLVAVRRHDLLLPALTGGRADLAVARYAPADLMREGVTATTAVDWVDELVVAGPGLAADRLFAIGDDSLFVHPSTAARLREPLRAACGGAVRLQTLDEGEPLESVLDQVAIGGYPAAVVDSGLYDGLPADERRRVIGVLADRRPLVWAVRSGSPRLRAVVDSFFLAEQALLHTSRIASCRDLPDIRKAGQLRVVSRSSPTTCYSEEGARHGFEYELARAFARRLGVRLEVTFPPLAVDPLDWLAAGFGDLVAVHEPVDPLLEGGQRLSLPYRLVDLVVVGREGGDVPASAEELSGATVVAAAPVASLCRLLPLEPPLRPAAMRAGADAYSALQEVVHARQALAVVDEDAARLDLAERGGLAAGCVVLPRQPLRWVFSPGASALQAEADAFLVSARTSGLLADLERRELAVPEPVATWTRTSAADNRLTPYDDLLRAAGMRHGVDWPLLAAIMYEESRCDPAAIGPGGSAGLYQLMPATWRQLGVDDPHHPEQAVEAGARLLRQLEDIFRAAPTPDRLAMAVASYNVGQAHVLDARRLAVEMGLDPNRWTSVQTALLLLDDPEVARRFPGGVCRCRRTVGYTRRVLRRYLTYAEQVPPPGDLESAIP